MIDEEQRNRLHMYKQCTCVMADANAHNINTLIPSLVFRIALRQRHSTLVDVRLKLVVHLLPSSSYLGELPSFDIVYKHADASPCLCHLVDDRRWLHVIADGQEVVRGESEFAAAHQVDGVRHRFDLNSVELEIPNKKIRYHTLRVGSSRSVVSTRICIRRRIVPRFSPSLAGYKCNNISSPLLEAPS